MNEDLTGPLKQYIDEGSVVLTAVFAPPRAVSTAFSRALNTAFGSPAETYIHEIDAECEFMDDMQPVLDAIERNAPTPEKPMHVVLKHMSHYMFDNLDIYVALLEAANNVVYLVREPMRSHISRLCASHNHDHDDKITLSPDDYPDEEVLANELEAIEKDHGWSDSSLNLLLMFELFFVQRAANGKKCLVIDGDMFRLRPNDYLGAIAKMNNVNFNDQNPVEWAPDTTSIAADDPWCSDYLESRNIQLPSHKIPPLRLFSDDAIDKFKESLNIYLEMSTKLEGFSSSDESELIVALERQNEAGNTVSDLNPIFAYAQIAIDNFYQISRGRGETKAYGDYLQTLRERHGEDFGLAFDEIDAFIKQKTPSTAVDTASVGVVRIPPAERGVSAL